MKRKPQWPQWKAKHNELTVVAGSGVSVSVEVPIDGFFYDARNWLEAFRHCITMCEAKLAVEEWRARL